jgi:hypothetical protein
VSFLDIISLKHGFNMIQSLGGIHKWVHVQVTSTRLRCVVLYCVVLCCELIRCDVLHCTALPYTALHCDVMCCDTRQHTM